MTISQTKLIGWYAKGLLQVLLKKNHYDFIVKVEGKWASLRQWSR